MFIVGVIKKDKNLYYIWYIVGVFEIDKLDLLSLL
jgi:hypothetical protein